MTEENLQIRIVFEDAAAREGVPPGPYKSAAEWRQAWEQTFGKLLPPAEALLAGWIYLFFWGMSVADRATMIGVVLGRLVDCSEIANAPKEHALKGWEDFPNDYPRAPITIEVTHERIQDQR